MSRKRRPPVRGRTIGRLRLTVPEMWRMIGFFTLGGIGIYLAEGDPGGLVAAGILFLVLFLANRN